MCLVRNVRPKAVECSALSIPTLFKSRCPYRSAPQLVLLSTEGGVESNPTGIVGLRLLWFCYFWFGCFKAMVLVTYKFKILLCS